jgi:hypothetical protein
MQVTPRATVRANKLRPVLRCNIDCKYVAQLVRLPATSVRIARGRAIGGIPKTIAFSKRRVTPGRYQVRTSVVAAVNPAPPIVKRTRVFALP